MAKGKRKLRRGLMRKAKKGYLTAGERQDLMGLDEEVSQQNKRTARNLGLGAAGLGTALAIANRSGVLDGAKDSLSQFLSNRQTPGSQQPAQPGAITPSVSSTVNNAVGQNAGATNVAQGTAQTTNTGAAQPAAQTTAPAATTPATNTPAATTPAATTQQTTAGQTAAPNATNATSQVDITNAPPSTAPGATDILLKKFENYGKPGHFITHPEGMSPAQATGELAVKQAEIDQRTSQMGGTDTDAAIDAARGTPSEATPQKPGLRNRLSSAINKVTAPIQEKKAAEAAAEKARKEAEAAARAKRLEAQRAEEKRKWDEMVKNAPPVATSVSSRPKTDTSFSDSPFSGKDWFEEMDYSDKALATSRADSTDPETGQYYAPGAYSTLEGDFRQGSDYQVKEQTKNLFPEARDYWYDSVHADNAYDRLDADLKGEKVDQGGFLDSRARSVDLDSPFLPAHLQTPEARAELDKMNQEDSADSEWKKKVNEAIEAKDPTELFKLGYLNTYLGMKGAKGGNKYERVDKVFGEGKGAEFYTGGQRALAASPDTGGRYQKNEWGRMMPTTEQADGGYAPFLRSMRDRIRKKYTRR